MEAEQSRSQIAANDIVLRSTFTKGSVVGTTIPVILYVFSEAQSKFSLLVAFLGALGIVLTVLFINGLARVFRYRFAAVFGTVAVPAIIVLAAFGYEEGFFGRPQSSYFPAEQQSRNMTSEEQATLQRLQDVWRGTCGTRGYDAYSQECEYYVTQKTVEWRKAAGVW